MRDLIERLIQDVLGALQTAKLYSVEHPEFKKALEKAMGSVHQALQGRQEIIIGIIGDELTVENEIFFELSRVVKPVIDVLKNKGVERITLTQGIEDDELARFISFLAVREDGGKRPTEDAIAQMGLKHISAGKIKMESGSREQPEKSPGGITSSGEYQDGLKTATKSLTDIITADTVDHLALRGSLHNILGHLTENSQDFMKLVTLRRYDQDTFVHLLNVSILSMYFSSRMGFGKDETLEIGMAGLFHDIGKMYISRRLLHKAERLTDDEFAAIHNHAVFGASILVEYADTLGMLPIVVAYEHHIKYDLSGYPKSPYNRKQHTASSIVSICDVYDALNQRRSYKADYSPDFVYSIMSKDKGTAFSPDLLDMFFKIMGVWPIGSAVSLSDGRIGVVRQENEDEIFFPVVEIIDPPARREMLDLRKVKDTVKITKFLNPWKEGKDILKMV